MSLDHAWVLHNDSDDIWLAKRTVRAFAQFGVSCTVLSGKELAETLQRQRGGWVALSGCVPIRLPTPGHTAHDPDITLAAEGCFEGRLTEAWKTWFLEGPNRVRSNSQLPPITMGYVREARALSGMLANSPTDSLPDLLRCAADSCRIEAASGLLAMRPSRPRVAYVIGSLHMGGAERVAIDLKVGIHQAGFDSRLYVLHAPKRRAYPAPDGCELIYQQLLEKRNPALVAAELAARWGADLVSAHLLDAHMLATFKSQGHHLVSTLHNDREGWPAGYQTLAENCGDLFIGCSTRVTREFTKFYDNQRVRTAWNGVRVPPVDMCERRQRVRQQLGVGDSDLLVLSVSNARPQKRLHLLAEIAKELRSRMDRVLLIHVGNLPDQSLPETLDRVLSNTTDPSLLFAGFQEDVFDWIAAADVYISVSAHEGLSIAQLEAATVRLPLVLSDTAGTEELKQWADNCSVLSQSATATDFAEAVLAARGVRVGRAEQELPSIRACVSRYARLFARSLAACAVDPHSLVLVSNDLQTGGAQSSLRRFAKYAKQKVSRVSVILIFDEGECVASHVLDLQEALVDVFFVPRESQRSGSAAADAALALIDECSPAVVAFWNVNVEVKLRLADSLLLRKVFDVSPGEMFFAEFNRYFQRPRNDLPYLSPADYASSLTGMVVKHHGEAQRAHDYFGIVPSVIHNGVPIRDGRRTDEFGDRVRYQLGTLVRLSPDKRLEELLCAMRQVCAALPDVVLFVGGGADPGFEEYARKLIASSATMPVVWLGEVKPSALFERIELFVLNAEPSGFPNASLEAMEHGLPVVSTDSGGMREQIRHGVNGWLSARGDPEQLARLLIDVLKDPNKLAACGMAARETVRQRFGVEHMGDRYLDLFGFSEASSKTI